MKKATTIMMVLVLMLATGAQAQFGIENKIRSKWEKKGKEHAQKHMDNAENKGMEEAEKGLDKAAEAAQPGLDSLDSYEQQGEQWVDYGLGKYTEFAEGYAADVENKDPEDYRRYGFESAEVIYSLTGPDEGTKKLYIDGGGYRMATFHDLKHGRDEDNSISILIGSEMISIDPVEQTAFRMHNPAAYLLANPETDWEEAGKRILAGMGYEMIGEETVAGKPCEIWKQGGHRIWVWRGLTLKSELGRQHEEATTVNIDVNVPDEYFAIPEGYEVQGFGADDMFPSVDGDDMDSDDMTPEEWNTFLDKIEAMTFTEYKAVAREENPDITDEEIRQSWLYLRQEAKQRTR